MAHLLICNCLPVHTANVTAGVVISTAVRTLSDFVGFVYEVAKVLGIVSVCWGSNVLASWHGTNMPCHQCPSQIPVVSNISVAA